MSAKNPRKRSGGSGRSARSARPGRGSSRAGKRSGSGAESSRPEPSQRINRLEECATFNERALEELTKQMLELDRRLRQLMSRLESLETRLTAVGDGETSVTREDNGTDLLPEEPE